MALVVKKCPYCNQLLPEGMATIGIGVPFRDCEKCEKSFIDSEVREWDNASAWWKVKLILGYIYGVWFYGVGCTVVPIAIVAYLLSFELSNSLIMILIAIGLIGSSILYIASIPAQIRDSKLRTADPVYRERLIKAGFKFNN